MLNFIAGITADEIAEAISGEMLFCGSKKIHSVSIDSRSVSGGELFIAIKGENTDGHKYINGAASSGASAVLIDNKEADYSSAEANDCSVIYTENTVLALGLLAKKYKAELNPITVAVTGSVGKTTTRQFVCSVLSSEKKTHGTDGNFNNELGLPLSVLKIDPSHEATVLELGMSQKGEISYLTSIAKPDIAIITNIGTAHIEYLGSREGIRDAKLEISEGLKSGGKLLLNGDEPLLLGIDGAAYVSLKNQSSDFRAANICYTSEGMCFSAVCPDRTIKNCIIPTFGEHTVLDAMFAVASGYYLGISDDGIRKGLSAFEAVGMRQNIVEHDGSTFILDYYNASPESIKASLSVTKQLAVKKCGRAVAVIGNVLELGDKSDELHRSIGSYIADIGCDLFFAFGKDACLAAEQAISDGMSKNSVFFFPDTSDAVKISEAVAENIRKKDCVLIKASHSVHMERIADILLKK